MIIEWVDPSDELIQNFKHLDGKRSDTNDYRKENFLQILKDNFDSVVPIGKVKILELSTWPHARDSGLARKLT